MTVEPLSSTQAAIKRTFDIVVSAVALALVGWLIPVLALAARWDTGETGIFRHVRVGRHGHHFEMLKVRTMRAMEGVDLAVTTANDIRITALGSVLRRSKLDELPQLWNVLRGEMSLVGPRPDVPGYYDRLEPPHDVLLTLRPGVTSPASIEFLREEQVLAEHSDPQTYNDTVLFPAKVALNERYLRDWSLVGDVTCLLRTVVAGL